MSYLGCFQRRLHLFQSFKYLATEKFLCSTAASTAIAEKKLQNDENTTEKKVTKPFKELAEYRFIYPEFLPHPTFRFRHKLTEKLERADMLRRRSCIDIPEFYVGSILAVTVSDPFAPGKEIRFVGICISRHHEGLRATFTLRNVVDGQGVEIMYDLYNPTIHKIEVLRLEKRLDSELYYLRDTSPEHSTFPFDMEPDYIMEGEAVKVNPIKVKLNPLPWTDKWYLKNLKGVEPFEHLLFPVHKKSMAINDQPWEEYDIMKQYRKCIPEEDQQEIWEDVDLHQKQFQIKRKSLKKRTLLKATRTIPRPEST